LAVLQAMRQVAGRSAEGFRRMMRLLPASAQERLRDVVTWVGRHRQAPTIGDWSTPLIVTATGATGPRNGSSAVTGHQPTGLPGPGGTAAISGHRLPDLRCLVVTSKLDTGGLPEVAAFLARRLPDYGLHTAVLDVTPEPAGSGRPSGQLGRMLLSNGIEVHETGEGSAPGWIERWRPDVISGHGSLPRCVLATAHRARVPYVDTLHGMHDLFRADWQAEAARSSKLSVIVSVSELVRDQYLAGNHHFPADRIVTIPNGVDDERRSGGDRAAAREWLGLTDEYLFVSLARNCLQKNTYGLVAAFGELARRRPEAHLLIAGQIGDIRYYRQVLRLRESLPCRERIHLRVHMAAPAELLAAADGFVLDSFFEGWALAPMEALFAGIPVVLSDVGGAREQIGHDPARGYLVTNPLGDPLSADWESIAAIRYRPQANRDEFATAMERLVAGREEYLRDRSRLAAESAARFSARRCLAQHAAVLRAAATGTDLPGNADASAGAVGSVE
jgi:glycosyltransferase involved in cell wall biosynthesis